jgi:hypothetical protein
METANLTKKQLEEYEFHVESVEFYKERSEEFRLQGNDELAELYITDCVKRHLVEIELILETKK